MATKQLYWNIDYGFTKQLQSEADSKKNHQIRAITITEEKQYKNSYVVSKGFDQYL